MTVPRSDIPVDPTAAPLSPLKRAFLALEDAQSRLAAAQNAAREPIAIIGLGCRVPGGGDDPDTFWQLLRDGVDAIGPVPSDRWDVDALYDPNPDVPGRIAAREGGFLHSIDRFDPVFFGISPREAQGMDPQQRLLLEVAWEALEHAGQPPDRLERSSTGVYVGVTSSDYTYLQLKTADTGLLDAHFASGIAHSIVSGRLSYLLGLQGPSLTLDTACSSSLVAVHLACQALRAGDCHMALAGGVNLILSPDLYIALSHSRMLAPDGRCKTFDEAADGFSRAEGCGIVVLKRLSAARTAGDRVLAVIRGSAVNQDGASSGLTAPSGPAQEAVIREALVRGGIAPAAVGYLEAHGTGTQLGDPLEVRALGAVFGDGRDLARPLLLGSVKTNIGHLEAAAGIVGLIKIVLALTHHTIPAHLHFRTPSPHIPWGDHVFRVPTRTEPWEPIGGRRIAGVSAFGFSGTNAHVVLEEAPTPAVSPSAAPVPAHLLTLSAQTADALTELAARYVVALDGRDEAALADVCYTANTGRARFAHRATIAANGTSQLRDRLMLLAQRQPSAGVRTSNVARRDPPRVAFLFTGQGAQYPGMTRGLYEHAPVFREALDRCASLLTSLLDRPLLDVLFPPEGEDTPLNDTAYTQPALFSIEYALAEMWRSCGVVPDLVLGHSVGEFAAACVAGVMSLEDAVRLIARRGALMQALPAGGAMAAIFATEGEVAQEVLPYAAELSIAAVNGPAQTVVSGSSSAVDSVCRRLAARGVRVQPLTVSHAFHSPLVDPILDRFEREVQSVRFAAPRIALISNLTGAVAKADDLSRSGYWRQHAREAVRFSDGVAALRALKPDCIIEIGPHPTLLALASATLWEDAPPTIGSLHKNHDDWTQMLSGLETLFLAGADIDWRGVYRVRENSVVDLPTYPFQRERCWFQATRSKAVSAASGRSSGHPLLGAKLRTAASDSVYESRLSASAPSFVHQHRVLGHIVLPATAFLDTLLTAAQQLHGRDRVTVEDVTLQTTLVLEDDGAVRTMQTVCTTVRDGAASASLSSAPEEGSDADAWTTHVTATLRAEAAAPADGDSLQDARARCRLALSTAEFYAGFERRGLEFGAGFRSVHQLFQAEGEALGEIELPEELAADANAYRMHPVLLDGCVQVIAAAMPDVGDDVLYLPIGIRQYTLLRRPGAVCWSHAVVNGGGDAAASADIRVFDVDGTPVAMLEGVQLKRVGRDALDRLGERWLDSCLYNTQWPVAAVANVSGSAGPSPATLAAAGSRAVPGLRSAAALDGYDVFLPRFEALCGDYVVQTLRRLGWTPSPGETVAETPLAQRLGVVPRHSRLFGRLLAILGEVGILARDLNGWCVLRPLPEVNPATGLADLADGCPPGAEAELAMTGRVAEQLAEALRGQREPMQLLFPDGSIANAESLYRDSPTARFFNGLIAEVVSSATAAGTSGQRLRILEVGAGTGGTTTRVVPRLPADAVEYTFTDIGPTFVARARGRFGAFPFMRFEVFDLEREPETQGFQPQSFDVVMASNVVHATRDVRGTLERLCHLLKPGGLLVMLEVTAPQRWFDLTVGLTDGWWAFADTDLRSDYATLSRERWLDVLAECGFEEPVALPEDTSHGGCVALQSVLVARARVAAPLSRVARNWLILADRGGVGSALADRLRSAGDHCTVVHARRSDGAAATAAIDPQSAGDYRRLLADARAAGRVPFGVIHAWSIDANDWDAASVGDIAVAETHGAISAMLLAQALVAENPAPRLWMVTSGAQQIDTHDRALSPVQAAVWGLSKSLAIEHPELRSVCVDLGAGAAAADIDALAAELNEPGLETQVALRGRSRHVARLARTRSSAAGESGTASSVAFRLSPETAGSIERFARQPMSRCAPGPGEVEIAVEATGLNFKDVLNALGMYPGDPGPLGGECAGRVLAVGQGVTHLRPGDDVLAIAAGSFASHVVAKAAFVRPRPVGMSLEEAASFPIAFITAEFCLQHVARLRAGERVLIHAGAGGVGMAAVQLARRAGAEVYATAGSPWKRELLRSLGVVHVMDSRTTSFAETIIAETGGRGVDVVLNSLSGDQIDASFRALAADGRFVEIGKRGIKDQKWVNALERNHHYHVVDWGENATRDPQLIGGMLERLVADLATGALTPLPRHVFTIDEADRAFRFMATARHAGRIVVRHTATTDVTVRREGTYLVTGGLSGLGLAVARWLAARGAGHLVLVGRRGMTDEAEPVLRELRALGTRLTIEALDVGDEAGLAELIARVRRDGPPLRGVVHSAGVLDDAGLIQQNAKRFATVFAPKTHGAYLLDRLTRVDPLDFFVLFSSVAAVLGSPGQSNHAAANAVLDALAHERRNRGVPGLSINWGPWKDVGAAADRGITDRLEAEGLTPLSPAQGLAALDRLLRGGESQVAVLSIDWDRYLAHAGPLALSPFLSDTARVAMARAETSHVRAPRQQDLREQVLQVTEGRRRTVVEAFIVERALRALGLDPSRSIDPRTPLGELGLDSLLAIELRNALATSLNRPLPATLLFDYPTVNALTDYVMTGVLKLEVATSAAITTVAPTNLVDSIEDLPDEEVDRLLAARAKGRA